jgi:hypothetical protein
VTTEANHQTAAKPKPAPAATLETLAPVIGRLSLIKENSTETGAAFHKYRISTRATASVPRLPPQGTEDRLRFDFRNAIEWPTGYRLTALSSRWGDFPRYIGYSPALDQAAECILNSRKLLIVGAQDEAQEEHNAKVYVAALRTLNACLAHKPQKSESITFTLCAVSLLSGAEIMCSKWPNFNYLTHAGGLGALIQAYGKTVARHDFGKQMVYASLGSIVINSIIKGVGSGPNTLYRTGHTGRTRSSCHF